MKMTRVALKSFPSCSKKKGRGSSESRDSCLLPQSYKLGHKARLDITMEDGESVKNLLVLSLSELAKKIENVTKQTREDFQVSDNFKFLAYCTYGIMELMAYHSC